MKSRKIRLIALAIAIIAVVPVIAVGGRHKDLYVNAKADEKTADGSANHPYKTIKKAIEHADSKTEIHVSKGEYEENITLKKGIKLFGHDKNDTILKAKSSNKPVVIMDEDSEIDDFTVKRGETGIEVKSHAKVLIISCEISHNKKDGITVEGGPVKKSNDIIISKTDVRKNGQSGIYVEGARRMVIMNGEISDNSGDGIDLAAGTSAWIEGNSVKNNSGTGLKATIDGSDIWTKSNSIRKNGREGAEVSFFGGAGKVDFSKSKIVDNSRYGIARLQRAGYNTSDWNNYLTFNDRSVNAVQYWGNAFGNVSPVIFVK